MSEDFAGGHYIGLDRKEPGEMPKKKSALSEIEELVADISSVKSAVGEVTEALNSLTAAANLAREALDRLRGHQPAGSLISATGAGGSGGGPIVKTVKYR